MKKALATILAVIYLTTSSGATVTMHYCMGKFSSVDFFKNDKCGKCGMKKADGCCHDDVKVIKMHDTHQFVSHEVNLTPSVAIVPANYAVFQPSLLYTSPLFTVNNNSPPHTPIFIWNCVFKL